MGGGGRGGGKVASSNIWEEGCSETAKKIAAKNRKRRKKGYDSPGHAVMAAVIIDSAQRILLNCELWCAEVYKQSVLNAGRAQVTKDLGHVFVCQGLNRFQFDDQAVVHEQVG